VKSRKPKGWQTAYLVPDMQIGYFANASGELEAIHDEAAMAVALAIAAGGVQIAAIAAQKPSFHRGGVYPGDGMAPDEREVSVRARANEAMFMTQQAIGSWASQIARLNTGQVPAQGGASVVVMMDGPLQTRGFARPDPGYGHAMIGGA
jgi:hypothetical protein